MCLLFSKIHFWLSKFVCVYNYRSFKICTVGANRFHPHKKYLYSVVESISFDNGYLFFSPVMFSYHFSLFLLVLVNDVNRFLSPLGVCLINMQYAPGGGIIRYFIRFKSQLPYNANLL